MIQTVVTEITKNLNAATFLAGMVFGIALSIACYTVGAFIQTHWKSTLIICAVVTSAALLMLAI